MIDTIQDIEWNPLRWALDLKMRAAIFLLRIYAGLTFVWVGYAQYRDPNFGLNLPSMLMGWAQGNPFFFYEDILKYIATPNAHILAYVLPIVEMTLGTFLILGLMTRWASLVLALLAFNFFLAVQHTSPSAAGLNGGFVLLGLILAFADAGHAFGMDVIVHLLGLRFGWIKPSKRRKKRVRLAAPKPLGKNASKLKEVNLPDKKSRDRDDDDDRSERRITDIRSRDAKKGASLPIEKKLGSTLQKLKERQQLRSVSSSGQARLQRYEPEDLDDDDEEDDDDIYGHYADDDDDE